MALGPFVTYVPPGVYTRSLTEANAANLVAGLRIPFVIGVGQEELQQIDLEQVRGSSSNQDQQIVRENVSQRFVIDDTNPNNPILGPTNGLIARFRVRNYPIVDGQGFGRTTNDARAVSVTINGSPVAVGSVQGNDGYVTLQVPPQPDDDVRCTYYFHRSDTIITDDVSEQVTPTQAILTTPAFAPFTVNAGITDTFVFSIDGVEQTIVFPPSPVAGYTAAAMKSLIDAALIGGLSTLVFIDNQGREHVRLFAAQEITIGVGNANGALGFAANTTTDRNKDFRVFQRPVVDGSDGGITTTDPSKVVAKVNGVQVIPTAVDGTNGIVTFALAPAPGSTVTIEYYFNTWQDTFDYLPNTQVTSVVRCGFSPGRSDFIQDQDFVVSNPSPDVSIVHWGTSVSVASTLRTPGAELFDDTQVLPTLVDDKMYLVEATRYIDTTVVPAIVSTTKFILPAVPTTGNGRDTPLGQSTFLAITNSRIGLNTNRPDLVVVYTGRDLRDALGRPASEVIEVDSSTRIITLKTPIPPDYKAFCTFWYNRITDDTFILTNKVAGPVGSGAFEIFSTVNQANVRQIRFGTKTGLPEIVQWPRGVEQVPDAFLTGAGTPVDEQVTITFASDAAKNAVFTNNGAEPYSFFTTFSDMWRTILNGTTYTSNLNTSRRGYLVSGHVEVDGGGDITVPASPGNELEITIDGVELSIALTVGAVPPATIVADINAVIDADAAFIGTAPNNLASFVQIGGATGDVIFIIRSYSTPAALPGGFDHASAVSIRQGTAENLLGFSTFQSASGSPNALNKAATIIGTNAGPFAIDAGVTDELNIRVDGIDYVITLPTGAAVATATIVIAINAVPGLTGVASAGTLGNLDQLRLTSSTNDAGSGITILASNSLSVLGFNEGDSVGSTNVSVQELTNALNDTAAFLTDGVAYPSEIDGQTYLTIESLTVGAAASSVAFVSGTGNAFNETTGTGIVPGTSGDNGEDARDFYTVTSNNPNGSAGTGAPGQTYTDTTTGLRFTILPSLVGSYTPGGFFTMDVSTTWKVNPAIPYLSVPGIELIVTDTVNVGLNDTATVRTFNPGGLEPAIGDFYYITYFFQKQDFTARLFQQFKSIEANFGPLSAENRVSLAAYLAILNGAVLVGIKQILKVPNTNQASDADFIAAIQELSIPLPGQVKPDIIVPLTTSTQVYNFLMQHCETQSNIRNQAERMGFIGFASGTSPTNAQTIARALLSNRIIAVYPDSAVITLNNEIGESFEQLVDGTFLAAALAGAVVSPAVDVATPYTRRTIQGFTRLPRVLDPVEANQTAVAGITLLEDLDPIIRVRQGLTTDMSNLLTRLPTVTQIADYVQQQSRIVLDAFVGTKFLASRTNEVEVTMTSLFNQLVQAEIVAAYTGIAAEVDPEDPTILRFEAFYQPIFPLLYLVLTFNIRARI